MGIVRQRQAATACVSEDSLQYSLFSSQIHIVRFGINWAFYLKLANLF